MYFVFTPVTFNDLKYLRVTKAKGSKYFSQHSMYEYSKLVRIIKINQTFQKLLEDSFHKCKIIIKKTVWRIYSEVTEQAGFVLLMGVV